MEGLAACRILDALVERHDNICSQRKLDLDGAFGRKEVGRPIEVGLEPDPVLGNPAKRLQAHDLKPSAIRKDRVRPAHEPVQSSKLPDNLVARTQVKMIGVGQKNLYS
jgi:hypothetical protein